MVRQRAPSAGSENSSVVPDHNQELGSMYDYLAKIILLGPSGCGKSCLLHRFVKDEWRVLTSQTIGVEFASKIIKVGTGSRRKRIKLQLWDTAGTERFRSVSRSYYRGAAGAILVYDIASRASFDALGTFLNDARALASPELTLLLVGNKSDLASLDSGASPPPAPPPPLIDVPPPSSTTTSSSSPNIAAITTTTTDSAQPSRLSSTTTTAGSKPPTTEEDPRSSNPNRGTASSPPLPTREVPPSLAAAYATKHAIPSTLECSALSGAQVTDIFTRLAAMILTKIELGEVDPDDPQSGIQYGDLDFGMGIGGSDAGSVKSGIGGTGLRRRSSRRRGKGGWLGGLGGRREWEEVFRFEGVGIGSGAGGGVGGGRGRRRGGCC